MRIFVEPLPSHGEEETSFLQENDNDAMEDEDEILIKDEEEEIKEDEEFFKTADNLLYETEPTYRPNRPMTLYSLTTRSFVNGELISHNEPISLKKRTDNWKLSYKLQESDVSPEVADRMYHGMRKRQDQVYNREGKLQTSFVKIFKSISERGLKFEKDD
ncbi:hypothetical protein BDC45DRAFT_493458, partial [Circinella umbellata]